MATKLQLTDGTDTIDFLASDDTYKANLPIRFPSPPKRLSLAGQALRGVRYEPRRIQFDLTIKGSSETHLKSLTRDLEAMITRAQDRQSLDQGTIITFTMSSHTGFPYTFPIYFGGGEDAVYRVLTGSYDLPTSILSEPLTTTTFISARGSLTLTIEPLGRLPSVSVTAGTLENEVDGTNLNYQDIDDIVGAEGGLLQLRIDDANNGGGNAWSGSKTMWIAKRSGERQTDSLFIQGEDADAFVQGTLPTSAGTTVFESAATDPLGNASGGDSAYIRWRQTVAVGTGVTTRVDCGYTRFDIAGGSLPQGLFRVLARISWGYVPGNGRVSPATGAMKFALGYNFGNETYTPVAADDVPTTLAKDNWETLDLGEISIPIVSTPDGFTAPTLGIRIHGVINSAGVAWNFQSATGEIRWRVDYIFLLPIDEGSVSVASVGTGDRILIDGQSPSPGVYILNTSNVVQSFATATGGPFKLGPEDTRIYVVRDDVGDPTTTQFTLTPTYLPQVVSL